jgi:GNAT superfamily N-acetyltransferase
MPVVRNWKKHYAERCQSTREALLKIHSGSRVFLSPGCGEPQHLVEELVRLGGESRQLNDVEIVHMLTVGSAPHVKRRYDRHFRHNSLFVGPSVRSAVSEGLADYTPIFLSEIPALFRSGRMPLDVALIQLTPPDDFGFCSLGVSVEAVKAAVESAELVIAQVNPQMPRTLGDSFLHVEDLDVIVEREEPILEVQPSEPDDIARAIARHATRLVENGSTIQAGIGKIPNAVLYGLADKKDLGVHTEMFSDGLIDLIESGVVNNSQKTFHPGKVLATFCIGTRQLYDYGAIYPVEMEHTERLGDLGLFFRPVKASDERLFQEYLYHLSERSVYLRFFQVRKDFPHELAQELVAVDYEENLGIVGTLGSSDTSPIIAAGHWMLDFSENMAEVAFSVQDEYQHKGIGTHLLHFLIRAARERGIRGFKATVLLANKAMMSIFQNSGYVLHTELEGGEIALSFRFDDKKSG